MNGKCEKEQQRDGRHQLILMRWAMDRPLVPHSAPFVISSRVVGRVDLQLAVGNEYTCG